jgi:hypothetical protein
MLQVWWRGERRGACRVSVGKPEGRRPLGRYRSRCEDNIKVDLREVGGGMDRIDLAQNRDRWRALVNVVIKPSNSIKCGEFLDYLGTCYLLRKDSAPCS